MSIDDQGREVIEIGSHRRGLLEELEKAHIYIAQLNEKIKEQAEKISELDALRTRLTELESAVDRDARLPSYAWGPTAAAPRSDG